jgi:hypothetical protein
MTNFSDHLFTDLMQEHGTALRRTELQPAAGPRHLRRGAWLAGGAGALAVGITASLAAFGGTASEAYAVTPHSDGTVTVALTSLSGITGANAALHTLGASVVVVPVRPGCPSLDALPAPKAGRGPASGSVHASVRADESTDGTITVQAKGIRAGDLLVIAVASTGHGTQMAGRLTTSPAPACVTLPPGLPAPGSGHVSGSVPSGAPAPGGTVVQTTGPGSAPATSTAG